MRLRPRLGPAGALCLVLAVAGCGATPVDRVELRSAGDVCPAGAPDGLTDWAAFVQHAGVQYLPAWPVASVPEDQLGPVVTTVTCTRSTSSRGVAEPARDGDAAYLPAGTPLRALSGVEPALRLAALVEDGWQVYDAHDVAGATRGGQLLDLRQVVRVSLVESQDGVDVVRSVEVPTDVERLVRAVRAAPVVTQVEAHGAVRGPLWFVRFELAQGPVVQRAWYPDGGVLFPRIEAPPVLRELLLDPPRRPAGA